MGFLQEWVGYEDTPDLEVKVNTITDFWSNPCNAPWTVYIETLYPALGGMFLALIDTSLLDVARSYFRPRGGLTRGSTRTKGRRRHRVPRIPDTADMFAKLIPGATIWQGMEYGANTRFLWQIDGVIQRGLWYWLVIDATTDGLYYWAQGIREERFCQPHNRPGLFATNPNVYATAFMGQWYPSPGWNVSWQEPGFEIRIGVITLPPGRWRFTYHAFYNNPGSAWGQVEVRLFGAGVPPSGQLILDPESNGALSFTAEIRGGIAWKLEQRVLGTPWVWGGQGLISVSRA